MFGIGKALGKAKDGLMWANDTKLFTIPEKIPGGVPWLGGKGIPLIGGYKVSVLETVGTLATIATLPISGPVALTVGIGATALTVAPDIIKGFENAQDTAAAQQTESQQQAQIGSDGVTQQQEPSLFQSIMNFFANLMNTMQTSSQTASAAVPAASAVAAPYDELAADIGNFSPNVNGTQIGPRQLGM